MLTRSPARHIPAIFFVLGAELPSQRGFLVEHDEQSNAEHDCEGDHNGDQVCLPKDDPQADPSGDETEVHRVPHIPVKAHENELLRRNHSAGVPCPVHPKSHTQRNATANPKTEGKAAI